LAFGTGASLKPAAAPLSLAVADLVAPGAVADERPAQPPRQAAVDVERADRQLALDALEAEAEVAARASRGAGERAAEGQPRGAGGGRAEQCAAGERGFLHDATLRMPGARENRLSSRVARTRPP
jgi:hypothetical protein